MQKPVRESTLTRTGFLFSVHKYYRTFPEKVNTCPVKIFSNYILLYNLCYRQFFWKVNIFFGKSFVFLWRGRILVFGVFRTSREV